MVDPGGGYVDPRSQAGSQVTGPTIQLPQTTPGQAAYTPDYSSMIGGSWEVGAAESQMAAQMAAARAQLQNSLRAGFIDLGYTGSSSQLGDLSKYIDKGTIQKAIDNKYSTYAQIKQQEDVANTFNQNDLIARGLGTSGTATETASDTIQRAEQARYEGLRNFLSGGQSGLSNLAMMKSQLAGQVLNARFAAAQRLAAMYPPTPATPAVEPNWNDFWGSYQGGVWNMPGGGNIVNAGTADSPAPWWVGQGSGGIPGDMSWLPGYGAGVF